MRTDSDRTKKKQFPGLLNLGNTCFANSVLQCLLHTPHLQLYCSKGLHGRDCKSKLKKLAHQELQQSLVNLQLKPRTPPKEQPVKKRDKKARRKAGEQESLEFGHSTQFASALSSGGKNSIKVSHIMKDNCLVRSALKDFCSFCLLEAHFKNCIAHREAGTKAILPLAVIVLLNRISDEFEIGKQHDSQEFLLLLLENLIQATFGYKKNVKYQQLSQSFIPRVFQGMLERQIICCSCKHIKTIQEAFLDLSLVSRSRQPQAIQNLTCSKGNQVGDDMQKRASSRFQAYGFEHQYQKKNSSPVDLANCLNEFFKTDTLDAQNKLFCENCEGLTQAQMRFRLKKLPNILVVHLKRFSYNGTKLKNALHFDARLKIDKKYMTNSKQGVPGFDLFAVIVHEGYSTSQGHYFCFILNQETNTWYKYDDDTVSCVGPSLQAKATQNACMLFYKQRGDASSKKTATASKKIEEENGIFSVADGAKGETVDLDFIKGLTFPKATKTEEKSTESVRSTSKDRKRSSQVPSPRQPKKKSQPRHPTQRHLPAAPAPKRRNSTPAVPISARHSTPTRQTKSRATSRRASGRQTPAKSRDSRPNLNSLELKLKQLLSKPKQAPKKKPAEVKSTKLGSSKRSLTQPAKKGISKSAPRTPKERSRRGSLAAHRGLPMTVKPPKVEKWKSQVQSPSHKKRRLSLGFF